MRTITERGSEITWTETQSQCLAAPPQRLSMSCISYLISVPSLGVRQLARHELKQDYSIGVDVGLETVRVVVLHPDDLGSLRGEK